MRKIIFFLLIIELVFSGCSQPLSTWPKVGGQYKMPSLNFETKLPDGWRRVLSDKKSLIITRDGIPLEKLIIHRHNIDEKLPYAKKKFTSEMLPQEISEIRIDNLRSSSEILSLKVIENTPAEIGGYKGLKIKYSFLTNEGLKKKGIIYGFMQNKWYYEISYDAAERYYFSKYLNDFENVRKNFKLLEETYS